MSSTKWLFNKIKELVVDYHGNRKLKVFSELRHNVYSILVDSTPENAATQIAELFRKQFLQCACPYAVYQFDKIWSAEYQLRLQQMKRTHVPEVMSFLLWVLLKSTVAVQAFRDDDGSAMLVSLKDIVYGVKTLGETFEWLLRMIYEFVWLAAKRVEPKVNTNKRSLADVYYSFGQYLYTKRYSEEAMLVFSSALPLVRGQIWSMRVKNSEDMVTMHQTVCWQLTKSLLMCSEKNSLFDLSRSVEFAKQAVCVVNEMTDKRFGLLVCRSRLQYANALHDFGAHRKSLGELKQLKKMVYDIHTDWDEQSPLLGKIRCRMFVLLGSCLITLQVDNLESEVYSCTTNAFHLAQRHGLRSCEAEMHMLMAKLYAFEDKLKTAKLSYRAAEIIFGQLGDKARQKICAFLVGKLDYKKVPVGSVLAKRAASWDRLVYGLPDAPPPVQTETHDDAVETFTGCTTKILRFKTIQKDLNKTAVAGDKEVTPSGVYEIPKKTGTSEPRKRSAF